MKNKKYRALSEAHEKKTRLIGKLLGLFVVCIMAISATGMSLGKMSAFEKSVTGVSMLAALPVFMVELDGKKTFKELKGAEWDTFKSDATAEELGDYFNAKNEASEARIKALIEGNASKEEVANSFAELKQAQEDMAKSLNDAMNKQIIQMSKAFKAATQNGSSEKTTLKQSIYNALEEKKAEIEAVIKNGGKMNGAISLQVKAAVTIGYGNTTGGVGSDSHYTLTTDTGIISTLRKRIMTYLSQASINQLSIDKPYAMWIEELDEQGDPIFIGEGVAKTQLSVRYEEREKKAKKIGVYSKISTEMLKYLPQLVSYIQNNLVKRLDIKTEDQLFNGDDTGENLAGIIGYATAFDGGVGTAGGAGLVGSVVNPNEYDVIRAAILQVYNSYGIASAFFVTPETLAEMDTEKSVDGVYVLPPFKSADGMTIAGVKLIQTNALSGTGIDFIGGDLSVINVGFTDAMSIEIDRDGNDFTTNKKTILVEQELVQFVSANDVQVLIKGDFVTAKAIIGV